MSYPAVKKKFNDILDKLNLSPLKAAEKNEALMTTVDAQPINETDSSVVRKIKEKLNVSGSRATIPLYSGDSCDIGEVVIKNGGKAVKGKARSGAKLGSDDLLLDSVEGYIAHKVHGVQIGETAFGPGFVIAAVLDWAEICHNEHGYFG